MVGKEMKLLFLRGPVPRDRDQREVKYESLSKSDDMWEHLAHHLGSQTHIVYWGAKYARRYCDSTDVRWVRNIETYRPEFEPDLIFARGGFPETYPLLRQYKCKKIYYGSGARYKPAEDLFDIVLVDSPKQLEKVGPKGRLWVKPAAPHFKPVKLEKKYDVCYIADARYPFRAKIKRTDWVYQTLPADIKMLHLGFAGKYRPRWNIATKRVSRETMPEQYSQCRIGIVPYTNYDSAPRVIPEMIACGLPVVAMDSVHYWADGYGIEPVGKDGFWERVRHELRMLDFARPPRAAFENTIAVEVAADAIRRML